MNLRHNLFCAIAFILSTSSMHCVATEMSCDLTDAQKKTNITIEERDTTDLFNREIDIAYLATCLADPRNDDQRKSAIEELNPGRTDLWHRKLWSLCEFEKPQLPVVIAPLKYQELFSRKHSDIGLRFLDLPLHMPDQGWHIPFCLVQFIEPLDKAIAAERTLNPNFEHDHYVYITVDQSIAQPHTSQRRPGWHVDEYRAFKNEQGYDVPHFYVAYDKHPTQFTTKTFQLRDIDNNRMQEVFEHIADEMATVEPVYYPNYTLLRLDSFVAHDVGFNHTDTPDFRTFIRIAFSKKRYANLGNTNNPLFCYNWICIPRPGIPYNKKMLARSSHRRDRDDFTYIDFSAAEMFEPLRPGITFLSKLKTKYLIAQFVINERMSHSFFKHAYEGIKNLFLTTINAEEPGNLCIYFDELRFSFPANVANKLVKNCKMHGVELFKSRKTNFHITQLSLPIYFYAAWGSIQYARPGDYVIRIDAGEYFALSPTEFNSTFEENCTIYE